MKQYYKDISISIFLLAITLTIILLTYGQTAIDIQLHDTYFVFDTSNLIILIIGPLTFISFLSLGLARRFRTTWTNIGVILGLVLISFIIFRIIELQKDFRDQIATDNEFQIANKEQTVGKVQSI